MERFEPMDVAGLLHLAYRRPITAANADEAFRKVQDIAAIPADPASFHAAVAEAMAAGLIADPVVLPAGALQCHWRLQLTPAGLARARALIGA
jgi:hypothetical protein